MKVEQTVCSTMNMADGQSWFQVRLVRWRHTGRLVTGASENTWKIQNTRLDRFCKKIVGEISTVKLEKILRVLLEMKKNWNMNKKEKNGGAHWGLSDITTSLVESLTLLTIIRVTSNFLNVEINVIIKEKKKKVNKVHQKIQMNQSTQKSERDRGKILN